QLTKSNISSLLKGFEYDPEVGQGYYIYTPKGWDYPGLIKAYEEGIRLTRKHHIPTIFHIQEMTQPQGHSTSGSHERYKSKERLEWEQEWDCINQMRNWILENDVATEEEIDQIETEAKDEAKEAKNEAYKAFINPIKQEIKEGSEMIGKLAESSKHKERLQQIQNDLKKTMDVFRRTIVKAIHDALRVTIDENIPERKALV
ncbi:MAG: transketolase, partial [Bacteroidetes bacterium SW_10_40_5]